MKRKFLLPALAVIFAVSGAFASSKFAPVYYASTDTFCQFELEDQDHCPPGNGPQCIEGGQTFRYKDVSSSISCRDLFKVPE